MKELVQMNKLEIDVLSRNSSSNKYIEVISNYRSAVDNYQKKNIDPWKCYRKQQLISKAFVTQKLMLEQLNQEANSELKALE